MLQIDCCTFTKLTFNVSRIVEVINLKFLSTGYSCLLLAYFVLFSQNDSVHTFFLLAMISLLISFTSDMVFVAMQNDHLDNSCNQALVHLQQFLVDDS